MSASFSLGRIAGIEIRVNWSLFIAFFLIAYILAVQVLPADVPGYAASSYWITGLLAVVLFYASLLAHELGHALVARRLGTRVDGITLWLFGGVAQLSGDSTSASAEVAITLVGPAITGVVAGIFVAIATGLTSLRVFPLVADVLGWLAFINLVLAVFNLIPAFPLDGGRVLRAILWRVMRDQVTATSIAAWSGRAFGVLLIVAGFAQLLVFGLGSGLNALWLGFLGWFLIQAAGSQELQTRLQRSLAGVRVSDVMSRDPITAPDWITVDDFIARFVSVNRMTAYPVRDFSGQLSGFVTLAQLASVPVGDRSRTQVRTIAHPLTQIPIARPQDTLVDVLRKLSNPETAHVLVMDGERLVGVISPTDIRRTLDLARLGRPPAAGLSPSS